MTRSNESPHACTTIGRDRGRHPASIKDVAAHAGVSVGTVSNVLNRPESRRRATRERVLDAIAELGFVRNESARHLRAGRSRTIGLVVLDIANPFFTDVARGVEEVAERRGPRRHPLQQRRPAGQGGRLPRRAAGAAGPGRAHHPDADELTPALGRAARARHAGRPGRPPGAGRGTSARSPSTTSSVASSPPTHLLEQGHRRIAFVGGDR